MPKEIYINVKIIDKWIEITEWNKPDKLYVIIQIGNKMSLLERGIDHEGNVR